SLLVNLIFFEEYQQEIQNTMTEKNTLLSLLSLDETSFSENGSLYFLSDNLKNDGKYLLIASKNSRELVNSFPFSLKSFPDSASVYRHEGVPYLVLADTLDLGQNTLDFYYGKALSSVYTSHRIRLASAFLVFLLLTFLVGFGLYITMKKIYMPVNQISHELRNPLTVIQGYAQYLRDGCLTEEDRCFAEDQLIAQTDNLKKIVEKILIMGNLREGRILNQRLVLDRLLRDIQTQYPSLVIESHEKYIFGDETLLKALLSNLISNALQSGDSVRLRIYQNKISVWNDGEADPKILDALNKRKNLDVSQIKGSGIGVGICRDIVHLYHGKLQYQIPEQGGTEAVVIFPSSMLTDEE
ncbi:MAG: sensor histidine kinase, partial [Blautia hydrogenotrophica]